MLAKTLSQTQLSQQKVALPRRPFSFAYRVKAALCCGADGEVSPDSAAGKPPPGLQHSCADCNKATPSDTSSHPATGVLTLIFNHCPIFITLYFFLTGH